MSQLEQILPGLDRWRCDLAGAQQPVNSYLWRRPSGTVLVDPAADLTPAAVGDVCVTDILITHLQEEHAAGSVHFPGARVHVPAGDEYLCQGRGAYEKLITKWEAPWDWETRGNYRGHLAGARNERPLANPLPLAEPLHPGQPWQDCEVLPTPGHGKSAVTIIASIAKHRVAFCGDLICGVGQLWNWFDCDWDYGLHGGQRALRESVRRLGRKKLDRLCPAHGPLIDDPAGALRLLDERLTAILTDAPAPSADAINFPEQPSPAKGFRLLLPNLHQWCALGGNCNVLVSATGNALMVDDGLCCWRPLPERAAHHRAVITELKRTLGIRRFEIVIPSHYHGDHLENIPELVEAEAAQVVSLDVVADVIEHPERYNLACPLPWYDAGHDVVNVGRRLRSGERLRWHEYELEFFSSRRSDVLLNRYRGGDRWRPDTLRRRLGLSGQPAVRAGVVLQRRRAGHARLGIRGGSDDRASARSFGLRTRRRDSKSDAATPAETHRLAVQTRRIRLAEPESVVT